MKSGQIKGNTKKKLVAPMGIVSINISWLERKMHQVNH
jgi:hypothetical protein